MKIKVSEAPGAVLGYMVAMVGSITTAMVNRYAKTKLGEPA